MAINNIFNNDPPKKVKVGPNEYPVNQTPLSVGGFGNDWAVYVDNEEDYNRLNDLDPNLNVFFYRPEEYIPKENINTQQLYQPHMDAARQLEMSKAEAARLQELGQVEALRRRQGVVDQNLRDSRRMLLFNALGPNLIKALSGANINSRYDEYRNNYLNTYQQARQMGADVEAADAIAKRNAEARTGLAQASGDYLASQIGTKAAVEDYIRNHDINDFNLREQERVLRANVDSRNAAELGAYNFGNEAENMDLQRRQAEAAIRARNAQVDNYKGQGQLDWDQVVSGANSVITDYLNAVDAFQATDGILPWRNRDRGALEAIIPHISRIRQAKGIMNQVYNDRMALARRMNDYATITKLTQDKANFDMFFDEILRNADTADKQKDFIDMGYLDELKRKTGFAFAPNMSGINPQLNGLNEYIVNNDSNITPMRSNDIVARADSTLKESLLNRLRQ